MPFSDSAVITVLPSLIALTLPEAETEATELSALE